MAIQTAHIKWRAHTPDKTYTRLCKLVRDLMVAAGWTVLTDQSDLLNHQPWVVLKFSRNTGFAGDDPVVLLQFINNPGGGAPYFYFQAMEGWNVGAQTTVNLSYLSSNYQIYYHLNYDCDIWLSTDSTFVLGSSIVNYQDGGSYCLSAVGVVCMQRLPGDVDPGCMFGNFHQETWGGNKRLFVPRRGYDNATWTSSAYNVTNKLNASDNGGMWTPDEAGNHAIFDMTASITVFGKLKGALYGVASATLNYDLPPAMLLPNAASPQWMVTRWNSDFNHCVLMAVAPTIQELS